MEETGSREDTMDAVDDTSRPHVEVIDGVSRGEKGGSPLAATPRYYANRTGSPLWGPSYQQGYREITFFRRQHRPLDRSDRVCHSSKSGMKINNRREKYRR